MLKMNFLETIEKNVAQKTLETAFDEKGINLKILCRELAGEKSDLSASVLNIINQKE